MFSVAEGRTPRTNADRRRCGEENPAHKQGQDPDPWAVARAQSDGAPRMQAGDPHTVATMAMPCPSRRCLGHPHADASTMPLPCPEPFRPKACCVMGKGNSPRASAQWAGHRVWIPCQCEAERLRVQSAVRAAVQRLPPTCSSARFDRVVSAALREAGHERRTLSEEQRQRVIQRWETCAPARRGTLASLPRGGRVLYTATQFHRGVDCNVQDGMADVALCHFVARCAAQEGDILLGISPARVPVCLFVHT